MPSYKLDKHVKQFLEIYPKFVILKDSGKKIRTLYGEVNICDIKGNYLESFTIKIIILEAEYPYTIPLVQEISEKIDRETDWHIDKNGFCCLDIDHKLVHNAQRGINLIKFHQDKIYPFFSNVVYRQKYNEYANGEYPHFFDGIKYFYFVELGLKNTSFVVKILHKIISNQMPGRNDLCLCLENKYKYCKHYNSLEFLKDIPTSTILKDLKSFEKDLG